MHHLGCWTDKNARAIAGAVVSYEPRETAVQVCKLRAQGMGYTIFAVQASNQCFTAADAGDTYQKYGASKGCSDGRGGSWANDVYEIICKPGAHNTHLV